MQITIDVSKFEADVKKLNFSDRKPALVKALLHAVEPAVELAILLAPQDTGLLSRSIDAAEDKKNREQDLVVVKFGTTTKAFYGLFQEFGTAHHPAQPFLEPALDRATPEFESRLVDSLNREIDRLLA